MSTLQKTINELKKMRKPVCEKCVEKEPKCSKIEDEIYCRSYYDPDAAWRRGDCPLADDHMKSTYVEQKQKVRVGQQKQKKHK